MLPCCFLSYFFTCINKTMGNSRKLDKSHVSTARDGHSLAKRIVNVWNSFPGCIVLSKSVATFRRKLTIRIFLIIVLLEFDVGMHIVFCMVACCKLHTVAVILFYGLMLEQSLCL